MTAPLTNVDVENIRVATATIAAALAPELVKIAAAASGSKVQACGDLLVAEPASTLDHRKVLWTQVFVGNTARGNTARGAESAAACADRALALFDARFP